MNNKTFSRFRLLAALMIILAQSCQVTEDHFLVSDELSSLSGIYQGYPVNVRGQNVWTRVEYNSNNDLLAVGLSIPAVLFKELPGYKTSQYGRQAIQKYYLDLPAETIPALPFDHVMMAYSPGGQGPGTMQFPQVNFNFYLSSKYEVIDSGDCIPADHQKMPTGFVPLSLPQACLDDWGIQWIHSSSTVFKDCYISNEIVAGSVGGRLGFYSPMASIEYLKNNPSVQGNIPLPKVITRPGLYPTAYSIRQEGSWIRVKLEKFEQKK